LGIKGIQSIIPKERQKDFIFVKNTAMHSKTIEKFSKLSKGEKMVWVARNFFDNPEAGLQVLKQYWNQDDALQKLHDEFIENTLSNFYLPFGVAPNFLINDELYVLPMVIEESSVVAAASRAAKFWLKRGGFKTEVISTAKTGQVHFTYNGNHQLLQAFFLRVKDRLVAEVAPLTTNMQKRGGGLTNLTLVDKTHELENYFQLSATFETCDAMGANFINSCLEQLAQSWQYVYKQDAEMQAQNADFSIVMSILSNYTPDCLVRATVCCPVADLEATEDLSPKAFAEKFVQAVKIAEASPYRAVTHNKGIMNGVDALVLATGNDFRAVEAGVHAFAAKDGRYQSLTHAKIENDIFYFWIEIPLALGTVGGLTGLHPLVKLSHEILGHPNAKKLMEITAVAGLAQNFAALNALVTSGIQKGHMKMHLLNILNQLKANEVEKLTLIEYFKTHIVSFTEVSVQLEKLRQVSTIN